MTPNEGQQLTIESRDNELPDNHWNRVYTDPAYFGEFSKRPSVQTGAELSPFPETFAKRQANIAYMSTTMGIPIEEMPAVYEAKKNELAKSQLGSPTLSDEGLFNYFKKQFDRENQVNAAADSIYRDVQKSVFESLYKGQTANDINNQPVYRPLLEQKLNEAGDLLTDQERLNIRENADKMADNLRRASDVVADEARWLFEIIEKQTGRNAGETSAPMGFQPSMAAPKSSEQPSDDTVDLNDPEMLNFQAEQVLERFADMPTERRQAIYSLAGAFAEINQVDKGVLYQAAETLGRFVTREMGERNTRNLTEELIRGQQRLLETDMPLYEATNLDGSKGYSQVPSAGQEPMTPEQREKAKQTVARRLKILQVKRELVNLADTQIDPIKTVTDWPTWEQGFYGFAGSIPYAGVAMIPGIGFPAITASFFGQYKDDLLLEYPDMDPDQAATIAALAAPMAAGLELVQANLLMGKFVALDRAIKFFLKPSRNTMTRIIARGTGTFAMETGVELTQNRVQPIVQTIGAALDEDIPGYNWQKDIEGFDEELGVTAVTMLLFTLTGLPFISAQEINRNADYLKDKKMLQYFGASAEQAERVANSLTKEERVKNWKDVSGNLNPKLVEAGRRQMFIDTMAQLKEPADPYQPTIRRDGERYTVLDSSGNVVADRVDADTAFYEFERIAGSNEVLFASVQGELINALLEAGKATNPEGFTEQIEVATQEVINRYNNMTPEQLQRRIAQWERETGQTWQPGAAVNITAVNTLEQVKEGLFQSITRVVKATTPEEIRAVLEDRAEGQYKMALQAGQFTEADMVGWIREYEAGTGDSLLEEDFTSRDVVEAVSTMAVAYYTGNLDNSRVSTRLRAFFEALKEYFTAIFARGVRIKEAIAAGQISPEFEAFLAQSVGLDLDRQIGVQAAQQARNDINGRTEPPRAKPLEPMQETVLPDGSRIMGPGTFAITAFHGSKAEFDKFDLSKIGTGEGAQVYGWGLYFAEERDVAEQYRIQLAYNPDEQRINGKQINEEYKAIEQNAIRDGNEWMYLIMDGLERLMMHQTVEQVIDHALENEWDQRALDYFKNADYQTFGNMYEVSLGVAKNSLLDWDTEFSKQPKKVRDLLLAIDQNPTDFGLDEVDAEMFGSGLTDQAVGGAIYKNIYAIFAASDDDKAGLKKASELLKQAGIKGIRYLDQGSRNNYEIKWRKYDGDRIPKAGWRTKIGNAAFPEDDLHAYIYPLNDGYAAYVEELGSGEINDVELGFYATLEEAKAQVVAAYGPTYNYVIFDEGLVEILTRNGQPVQQESTFAISAQQDASYLAAVQAGDMETAQRMVDEAAAKAGYPVKAFHGTNAEPFTEFDPNRSGEASRTASDNSLHFTSSKQRARSYVDIYGGGRIMEVFLAIDSDALIVDMADSAQLKRLKLLPPGLASTDTYYDLQPERFQELMEKRGAFEAVIQNGDEKHYVLWSPNSVKSADPVTYDASGNVIPLSQRFNPETANISFSISQSHDALKMKGKGRSDIDLKSLPRFADDTKSHLVDEKLAALDAIYREVGDPLESEQNWFSYVRAIGRDEKNPIIMPPARAMEYAKGNNITRITDDLLKHPEFVEARESGLAIGAEMLAKFRSGELGRSDLASLFVWGLLSRGVGAYPQEGGFLALHNNGLIENLDKVFAGEMTLEDLDAWSRASMKGSPGASSTQNAMKVADQMRAMMTEIDGRMAIDVMLDAWKSGMTGPQLRREVRRIFTNDRPSIQIQNKVLSFIILVSGRPDVLVLDRVQFRHMWGGKALEDAMSDFHKQIAKAKAATIKKYGKNSPEAALAAAVSDNPTNIYDALPVIDKDGTFKFAVKKGDKAIATDGIAKIGDGMHGMHGMALYEALERSIDKPVAKAYKDAGISYPGVGAFHWDSWLVESQQAISHPTLAVIAQTDMRPSLGVTEGKFNKLSYGMIYRYDGLYMRELLTRPGVYAIFNQDEIKRFNTKDVFKAIGRKIPLESNEDGSKRVRPWVNDLTEQERERFDGYLSEIASRTASVGDAGYDGGTDGGGRSGSGQQPSVGTFAISPANYYGDLQAAVAALDSNPAFRRERVAAVLSKFKRIKDQFANKDGLEPLSMPEAVAQLEAIITLLPPDAQSEVGGFRRLLSFSTAKGRLNYLTDRIAKADAALEKYLRTELQEDILSMLERAAPKRGENKIFTSTLGPEAQRVANMATAAINLTGDEVSDRMSEIEAALTAAALTPEKQEQLLEEWAMLNMMGDFLNRSALELDQARAWLRQTFGAGRARWRMQEEARRRQYRDMAEELAGGLKKATENQIDKMDKENPWLKNPRQFILSHYSFMQLLRSVLPKTGFIDGWEKAIRQAEIGSSRYRMDAAKRFIDVLMAASGKKTSFGVGRVMYDMRKTRKAAIRYKEGYNEKLIRLKLETAANILEGRASWKAFGLKSQDVDRLREAYLAVPIMRRRTTPDGKLVETVNRQEFVEFYVLENEGTDDKLTMSPAEAMQLLLSWDQADVQARMRRQGWTDESIEDMQKMVASVPGGEATMDFLRREYKEGGDKADPVYMRMFGMAMPRIENYAPTRYRHRDDSNDLSPLGSTLELAGTTPGSLKSRQRHDARMRRTDAITVFFQHVAQMGHWIHFAEINREVRGVLKNQNVREAMEATIGRSGLQIFDQWMDTLAQGGGRRAMELSADRDIWAALISGKSIASLGFSVRTLFMQIDSASRAALDMGMGEFAKALMDPRWISDMPTAWNSDTVQRRLIEGSRPEVRYVFERAAVRPSMLLWAAQKSMVPMQLTDAALTSFTAALVYRNAYNKAKKAGASDALAEQDALDAMDKAVFNYSQPIDITSRSLREVQGNMLQKIYMMFLSDARLKSALFFESLANLGKEGKRTEGAKNITVLLAMAALSQTMGNLFRDWFDDEPDDEIWTLEGYAMAMMLAPFAGLMLVGTVADTVVSEAFGEFTFQQTNPASETISRGVRAVKGWDNTFDTSDPEAMIKQWNNILRFASVNPTLAAPAALLNLIKPIEGAMKNAANPE